MAKIGYARVSARSQKDDSQVDELTAYGCDKIFTGKTSGKLAERPELDKALTYLRESEVFVITRLSRAMRSLKLLLALPGELRERGADLVILEQDIDTTTPGARRGSAAGGGVRPRRRNVGPRPGRSQIHHSAPVTAVLAVEGVVEVDEQVGFDIDDRYPPVPVAL